MATLEKHLAAAKQSSDKQALCNRVEKWLATFSVNDDVNKLREQMVQFIVALTAARCAGPVNPE